MVITQPPPPSNVLLHHYTNNTPRYLYFVCSCCLYLPLVRGLRRLVTLGLPSRRRQCTVSTSAARTARGRSSTAADVVQPLDNRLSSLHTTNAGPLQRTPAGGCCLPVVGESRWIATFDPCVLAPPTDFRLGFSRAELQFTVLRYCSCHALV